MYVFKLPNANGKISNVFGNCPVFSNQPHAVHVVMVQFILNTWLRLGKECDHGYME